MLSDNIVIKLEINNGEIAVWDFDSGQGVYENFLLLLFNFAVNLKLQ